MCDGSVVDSYDDLYCEALRRTASPLAGLRPPAGGVRRAVAFGAPPHWPRASPDHQGRRESGSRRRGGEARRQQHFHEHFQRFDDGAKKAQDIEPWLSEAAITAALSSLKILLVGPTGRKSALERSAADLQERVLLNRAPVVYNYLQLRHVLLGGPPPPPPRRMMELMAVADKAVRRHRWAETDTFESESSDVANVRAAASSSSANAVAMGGFEEPNDGSAGAAIVDVSESAAVFGRAVQSMGAVVESVAAAVGTRPRRRR